MDCVSICPPRLGQEAALYGLKNLLPWARAQHRGPEGARRPLSNGLQRSNRWRLVSIGAYFAYVEHPFAGQRSTAVSERLADEENLLTIPGDMFGAGQEALRAPGLRQRRRRQDPGRAGTAGALRRLSRLAGEVGVQRRHDLRALADRRSHALDRARPHVAHGEHAASAGFERQATAVEASSSVQTKPLSSSLTSALRQPAGVGLGADEQEHMAHVP